MVLGNFLLLNVHLVGGSPSEKVEKLKKFCQIKIRNPLVASRMGTNEGKKLLNKLTPKTLKHISGSFFIYLFI